MKEIRIDLRQKDIPTSWYNLSADIPLKPLPPLLPDGKPVSPQMLERIFPANLIEQKISTQRWIKIPEEIIEILLRWRPTPLKRAVYLENYLKTPARIYYKDESISPAGSHKPNTAVAQAWYNKKFGIKKLTTETGAGQWGSALAFVCCLVGLECKVYMVRISYEQKPMRRIMMQVWNARCVPSPSRETSFGRRVLKKDPSTPGSLGIAISEAIEETLSDKSAKTRYSLGSVLNFVLLHQTIIGLEAKRQLNLIGEKKPDIIVGCVGGGSNFAGLSFPFLSDKINGQDIEVIAVEPTACPTLTRGEFAYDYGDTAGLTPLLAMYTLGHNFIPEPIHAGGLRYHGMAPLVSAGVKSGLIKPVAYDQIKCYQSALIWARTEGSIPAPETSHAIACVIDEALKAKKEKKSKVILFNYSGHGLLDLTGYDKFLQGKLKRYHLEKAKLETSLKAIKNFPKSKI